MKNVEPSPGVDSTLDFAAVGAGEVFDDGEAEACAAHLARAGAVNAVEALEDARDVLRRDAVARVGDSNSVARVRVHG